MEPFKSVWNFFNSDRLALFTSCAITLKSIIDIIIPQKDCNNRDMLPGKTIGKLKLKMPK